MHGLSSVRLTNRHLFCIELELARAERFFAFANINLSQQQMEFGCVRLLQSPLEFLLSRFELVHLCITFNQHFVRITVFGINLNGSFQMAERMRAVVLRQLALSGLELPACWFRNSQVPNGHSFSRL